MRAGYEDIRALADKLGLRPLWWDQDGVPRYIAHHPSHAANIYAHEVALLRIACQRCGTQQLVQMTWGSMDTVRVRIYAEWAALSRDAPKPDVGDSSLAEFIRTGSIHYGDPPHHDDDRGEFCHAGCTMNCEDLAVVEYWRNTAETAWTWQRDATLEVELPQIAEEDPA